MSVDAFWRVYGALPQAGPGNDASTERALARLDLAGGAPRPDFAVLDLGCGPGRQTLVLARVLGVPITAIDLHAPFLETLDARTADAGLADRIRTRVADFGALADPPGSIDLVWSEGAIYHLGFAAGLARWRPLLRPGGRIAVTELTWLVATPPADAAAFWCDAYPGMGTTATNVAAAEDAGFEIAGTFVLPPEAWWDDYYRPLAARADALAADAERDPALAQVIADAQREIALFRDHSTSYGYVFYLLAAR